ncbi:MAG: phosphatidylinositol dimannoside acyltransferase [Chloroflexota bacterium]|nr:phosphatidylinositol dimannoside acyltransferase [Chloroflexota bacterium]
MTDKGLEAPHRRREQGPRIVEKAAVTAYAAAVWLVAHVPVRLARWVIGTGSQAGYLLWPTKRAWSNANFGRVAGLPPDDRRVRRLALRAYRAYATYLVEVMRLESLSVAESVSRVVQTDLDQIEAIWKSAPGGGLIFALGHVGNNEAVAAGVADRGWPISVVADDSSFPEMFERFRRLREGFGVHVIPWKNLREIYRVLKNREMLALLIDWGYRADGVPVRMFGAWTTLPAGPATLAAKTKSLVLPVAIRRGDDGMFHVSFSSTIAVASSSDPDIARATQEIATALEVTIGAAPEQWYSFKPMWPPTEEEGAELAARAARMLAGEREPRAATPGGVGEAAAVTPDASGGDPRTELAPS